MANAFGKIKSEKTSTARSTKISATVTDAVKVFVDGFIQIKAEIARLTAEKEEKAQRIREHVQPQQDKLARDGAYSKSFEVTGSTGNVTYTTTDQFSLPQDDDTLAELKKLIGPKLYEEFFTTKQTISIKDTILKDDKKLNAIASACEKAGLAIEDIFDRKEKLVSKDDLDKNQYQVSEDKFPIFRSLVGQYKAAIK